MELATAVVVPVWPVLDQQHGLPVLLLLAMYTQVSVLEVEEMCEEPTVQPSNQSVQAASAAEGANEGVRGCALRVRECADSSDDSSPSEVERGRWIRSSPWR